MVLSEITKGVGRKSSTLRNQGKGRASRSNREVGASEARGNQKSVVLWKPVEVNCFKKQGDITWVRYC